MLAASSLPLAAAGLALALPAQAGNARAILPGTAPSWATSAHRAGTPSSSASFDGRVYLAPRAGLAAFVAAVSNPRSTQYAHYLTPAQYSARFAPTTTQVNTVSSWLTSAGLKITGSNSHYLSVHGTLAQAGKAFGTTFATYRHGSAVDTAPTRNASVPAALAGSVLTVTGLDSAVHMITPASQKPFPPPDGFANARPCSTYYGEKVTSPADVPPAYGEQQPYAPCGYTPAQLRGAYQVPAGLDGSGVTVAITDAYAAGTIESDANTYSTNRGEPTFTPGQFTQSTPRTYTRQALCGSNGWYGEETLDVEAVHGMAPAADIVYVASASCFDQDFLDAFARIVDNHLASIVTNSWSDLEINETPAYTAAYEQMFQQGAAEGIGFYFSSGDNGDESGSTPDGSTAVDYPASDPYATAVGGTTLAVGASNDYEFEVGWGTYKSTLKSGAWSPDLPGSFLYGAGGGVSGLFAQPSYQQGITDGVSSTNRAVPDIAADADPTTGMLIGETQVFSKQSRGAKSDAHYGEYRLGGTSLASPLIAGVQALAEQAAGHAIGFANPAIYAGYGTASYNDVVDPTGGNHVADVRVDYLNGVDDTNGVVYSLRTSGMDSSLVATSGYDDVTGVGTPAAAYYTSY